MSDLTPEERQHLLDSLARLAYGEGDISRRLVTFLPLSAHRLALRSENVLVRGGRGAGKTALFQVLKELRTSERIRWFFSDKRLPDALWLDGFSDAMHHPHVSVVDAFAEKATEVALRAFWMSQLLRRLHAELKEDAPELPAFLRPPAETVHRPDEWMAASEFHLSTIAAALDQAERCLELRNQTVFIAYDNLDRLGMFDKQVRQRCTGALLALWLSLSSRYRRMRAKIFLREDLLDAAATLFPDASKLRSIDLEWDVPALFRVLVRHMANASDELRAWLLEVPGIVLSEWKECGWMPAELDEDTQRALVTRLAGATFGSGSSKSHTLRWIINRLRDGQERIVPRSLLGLLGYAALEAQQNNSRTKGRRLLAAKDLEAGLTKIAKQRLTEMREDWPVVHRVDSLIGATLPMERTQAQGLLGMPRPGEPMGLPPDGEIVLENLLGLGVLSLRSDGLLDMPDIYRVPQGIRRQAPAMTQTEEPAELAYRQAAALASQAESLDGVEADSFYRKAIESYQAVLDYDPMHVGALVGLALVLREQSAYKAGQDSQQLKEAAIRLCDKALKEKPTDYLAKYCKAVLLIEQSYVRPVTESTALLSSVDAMMGAWSTEQGMFAVCQWAWGLALEENGANRRGSAAEFWFAQAEEKYRTEAETYSTYGTGHRLWSELFARRSCRAVGGEAQSLLAQAMEKIQAALQRQPASPANFAAWGGILEDQARQSSGAEFLVLLSQADEKYRVALQLSSQKIRYYIDVGRMALKMAWLHKVIDEEQAVARALQNFHAALRINSDAYMAYVGIGNVHLQRAERQSVNAEVKPLLDVAHQNYSTALRLAPTSIQALDGLASLLIEEGRRSKLPGPLWEKSASLFWRKDEFRPGSGAYGFARLAALHNQADLCQAELLRSREYGYFPSRPRFENDEAFAALKDQTWFKEFPF